MENEFSIDFHPRFDKKFDCPQHKVEGKYFIVIYNCDSSYCSSQEIKTEEDFIYKSPENNLKDESWGSSKNLKWLLDDRSKIENER